MTLPLFGLVDYPTPEPPTSPPPRRSAPSLPPGLAPRGLSKAQAAAYVGCETISAFEAQVKRHLMPGPMHGTVRWDRKALDAAMDKLSGFGPPEITASPGSLGFKSPDELLRDWKREHMAIRRGAGDPVMVTGPRND